MKLGNKIKKYRRLNKLSQKELGLMLGFSSTTADSRIRKYESGAMAPKADIRSKLAEALNIDIEAISDIEISTFADIMYVLFELEEKCGLSIEKKDGKTSIVLDDTNSDIEQLVSFITAWKDKRDSIKNETDEAALHDYEIWKSHFLSNINDCYTKKKSEIDNYYNEDVSSCTTHSKTSSDMVRLLRKIIESGMSIQTRTQHITYGVLANGFTFKINELLNPPTEESRKLFAQFLADLKYIEQLGAKVFVDVQMPDGSFYITYYIEASAFSLVVSHINNFLRHYESMESQSEYAIDLFESNFESTLDLNSNTIENMV